MSSPEGPHEEESQDSPEDIDTLDLLRDAYRNLGIQATVTDQGEYIEIAGDEPDSTQS